MAFNWSISGRAIYGRFMNSHSLITKDGRLKSLRISFCASWNLKTMRELIRPLIVRVAPKRFDEIKFVDYISWSWVRFPDWDISCLLSEYLFSRKSTDNMLFKAFCNFEIRHVHRYTTQPHLSRFLTRREEEHSRKWNKVNAQLLLLLLFIALKKARGK